MLCLCIDILVCRPSYISNDLNLLRGLCLTHVWFLCTMLLVRVVVYMNWNRSLNQRNVCHIKSSSMTLFVTQWFLLDSAYHRFELLISVAILVFATKKLIWNLKSHIRSRLHYTRRCVHLSLGHLSFINILSEKVQFSIE